MSCTRSDLISLAAIPIGLFTKRKEQTLPGSRRLYWTCAAISSEPFPYIQPKYPASSTRLLIAHSMAGLEGINLLLRHPDNFDDYAAIVLCLW